MNSERLQTPAKTTIINKNYQSWLKDKEKLSVINLKRFMTIEPGQQRIMKGICQTEESNKHLQDVTVKNK